MDMKNLNLPCKLLGENMDLGTFPQTVSLVSRLLATYIQKPEADCQTKRRELVLRQNFSWVLNGHHRLRKVILKWLHTTEAKLALEEEQVPLQYLTYLRECCVSEPHSPDLLSGTSLTCAGFQCLAEFLILDNINQFPALQVGLSHFLDDLLQTARRSESCVRRLREIFWPTWTEIQNRDANLQSFESSLQVISQLHAVKALLCSVLTAVQNSMRRLQTDLLDPVSAEPVTASQKAGTLGQGAEQDEDVRSPKRLCLPASPVEPSSQTSLQLLMSKLSALVNCETAETLAALNAPTV